MIFHNSKQERSLIDSFDLPLYIINEIEDKYYENNISNNDDEDGINVLAIVENNGW